MFRRIPMRNRIGEKQPYSLCRRPVLHPANVICLLDNLLHRLHFDVNVVCDLHDRLITGEWIDDERLSARHRLRRFLRLDPVETKGPSQSVTYTGPGALWVNAASLNRASGTTTTVWLNQSSGR